MASPSRWLLLLCELGRHRAEPSPAWNNGYYFSRCRRCRRDLVRTTYSGWEVPRGYRVIWRAEEGAAARVNAPGATRIVREKAPLASPAPLRPAQRAPRIPSAIPDFMDEPETSAPASEGPADNQPATNVRIHPRGWK